MVIKKVLIDLSGTLHIDTVPINGAINALNRLRENNLEILFVTNTTDSRRSRYEKMVKMGFKLSIDEMWTSIWGTRSYILSNNLNPLLLVDDVAKEDFSDISVDSNIKDSVVIGLATYLNYDILTDAFSTYVDKFINNPSHRILINGGKLIATHEGRYFQTSKGLALGPGMFVKGLEYAADCKAHVVGKPNPDFFKAALNNVDPSEAVMIGDDVRDDVAGAQAVGIKGFLVQTGKYRAGDEDIISPKPSWTVPSFAHAVDIILNINGNE